MKPPQAPGSEGLDDPLIHRCGEACGRRESPANRQLAQVPNRPLWGRTGAAMLAPPQASTRSAQPGVDHPIELTAESLWSEVSSRLRGALNDTTFRTWFAEAGGAELDDESFILAVPNDFTR